MKRIIRIGSRESALAVAQSEMVRKDLKKTLPEAETELVTMKTTGDKILDRSLEKIGGKGLFVKELDLALIERRCDLAVHCLKDMPMESPKELPILAYSEREDRRDVLVLRAGLSSLPECPRIGTSSKRRRIQARKLFPRAEFPGCRGNLITRLKKLDDGEFDALILAAAGLKRLGFEHRISRYFTLEEMIPAAGQGILTIQGRAGDDTSYLEKLDSQESRLMAQAERAFVRTLNGGCTSPAAATAVLSEETAQGRRLILTGLYYEEKTGRWKIGTMEGASEEAERLGETLAVCLKESPDGPWEAGE